MSLIYIIEDEPIMADCIAAAIAGIAEGSNDIAVFNDGVSAMEAVNERLPDVILLDIMLTGPNGFAFLNEMISYPDTAKIPVILISSLDLPKRDLSQYGVVQTLDKAKMTPEDIYAAIKSALQNDTTTKNTTSVDTLANIPDAIAEPIIPESVPPVVIPENPVVSLDDFKQKLADSNQASDAKWHSYARYRFTPY